jgi:hypothetical protein
MSKNFGGGFIVRAVSYVTDKAVNVLFSGSNGEQSDLPPAISAAFSASSTVKIFARDFNYFTID